MTRFNQLTRQYMDSEQHQPEPRPDDEIENDIITEGGKPPNIETKSGRR